MRAIDTSPQISLDTINTLLLRYNDNVPAKIQELEKLRVDMIPETLTQRKKDGKPYLDKAEVTGLVEWKLKHGTYRPNLAKLVASNSTQEIHETTQSVFDLYDANPEENYAKAITALSSKLKGIGPATASLLLSCYDPVRLPFFSDELYRYLHWEAAAGKSQGGGWDRKINYTIKEYKSLFDKVTELRERLEKDSGEQVPAIDIERAAYVLGKEALRGASRVDLEADDAHEDKALQSPPAKRRRKAAAKS